ncbi:hypothetical protein [Morganella morganii]|uniref:hypothetical protein n=1 Tax=Morganella morganii TaxID=582 RepID=UPI0022AD2B8C|nr:hypothetical protein [Morganella morganii]
MSKLYNIITMGDSSGKEITLPSGKYHINNIDIIESGDALIPLSLPVPDSSLQYIEAELHEDHYCVSCITHNNEIITTEVGYNALFSYQGIPFFAVKEQQDTWHESILSVTQKTGTHRSRFSGHTRFYAVLIVSVLLTAGLILLKNQSGTDTQSHTISYENIIRSYINNNEYIIKDNNILVFSPTRSGIAGLKKELPDYTIFEVNKTDAKIDKNDIIIMPDFNKRKEIVYIYQENKIITTKTLNLPDELRDDITIRALSFSDIVKLINDRFDQHSIRYSVKKSGNTIWIHADKRRDKETETIIKDINTTIFSAPGNTLVQYREIRHSEPRPGVYGTDNYTLLSDSHIHFNFSDK